MQDYEPSLLGEGPFLTLALQVWTSMDVPWAFHINGNLDHYLRCYHLKDGPF